MPTKVAKCLAIAALLILVILWRSSDSRTLLAGFMACAGAVVVMIQAARVRDYGWMLMFFGMALLFNPLISMTLAPGVFLALKIASLMAFALSWRMSEPSPRLSMASITDRTPGSESL